VLGHEISGTVSDIDSEIKDLSLGQKDATSVLLEDLLEQMTRLMRVSLPEYCGEKFKRE